MAVAIEHPPPAPAPSAQRLGKVGAVVGILALAGLLRVISGVGFANYDTLYALVWGQQLSRLQTPQYGIPIAPTPHPLVEALGFVLAPLGPSASEQITVWLGYLALAGCTYAIYRLGALWFGRAAGLIAALVLITRVPVLSYGVRAYVDIPYLLFVLLALLIESRRPLAGAPVLMLLGLAGLLRPEAWVFSALYWLYLALAPRFAPRLIPGQTGTDRGSAHTVYPHGRGAARSPDARGDGEPPDAVHLGIGDGEPPDAVHVGRGDVGRGDGDSPDAVHRARARARGAAPPAPPQRPLQRSNGELASLALLALAAPLVWVLSDWLVTGNPLWSLTNTRATAKTLDRVTGIANVPEYIPRRVGEILRPPVLVGAALGGVLTLLFLRSRAQLLAIAGVIAVVVLAAFTSVGLPLDTRYAFLIAAILCVFYGAGVCGWMLLPAGDPNRRWWMIAGIVVLVGLFAYAPAQYRMAHSQLNELARQQSIENDLIALVNDGALSRRCEPVGVPNHAPIPLLALYLKSSPAQVRTATISSGAYLDPASKEVEKAYVLDPNDPHPLTPTIPPGFSESHANRSWIVFQNC